MLAEALLFARARLGGQRNRHGHLAEQVGLWARHRRQRQAWAPHLARARALCIQAAEATPPARRRTALVLGAGLLLDVPLHALSGLFGRVVLADMAFLPSTLSLARSLGNVEVVQADLSACLDALPGPVPEPDLSLALPDLDFVYSANLLSQLPLHVLTALRACAPEGAADGDPGREEACRDCAAAVVRSHVQGLLRLPCPACLVTDTVERGLAGGRAAYEADLLFGVGPRLFALAGDARQTWTWRLAPRGEADPRLDLEREVLGVPDLRDPGRGGDSAPVGDGRRGESHG